jgi:hypothetical protein
MHHASMEIAAAPLAARQPRAARAASRPITAASDADLTPFQAAEALEAGQVLLISLDPVADHLSATWQGRRTEAYDRAARVLGKRLSGGAFLRISETDYLLAQPAAKTQTAEEAAVRALDEIVSHFIGDVGPEALRLFAVRQAGDGRVVGEPLDARAILERADRRERRDDLSGSDILSGEAWAPFVTGEGRKVRPSCVLEPVFEIAGGHRIGYHLRRTLIDVATGAPLSFARQHSLTRADVLRIDRATLERGIERLNGATTDEAALSLIMPVSYLSLTHPEAGAQLSRMFARARKAVAAGVICEIHDIEGIGEAPLAAATALVKPWSLFVVGHLAEEKPKASPAMKAAGIQVLSFTAPSAMESDAEFIGWLSPALRSARRVGRSVMVYGCRTQRRMMLAGKLGATHASLSA